MVLPIKANENITSMCWQNVENPVLVDRSGCIHVINTSII